MEALGVKLVTLIKGNVFSTLLVTGSVIASGFVVNIMQILLHVLVKPFNKDLFDKLMYYISYTWLSHCVFIADYWSSSEIIIHCKSEDYELLGKEHAFVLINHCYETDWLFLWALCEKLQILGGARGFGKNMIKHIPIAGWFFNLAGHIFLARDYEKDKDVIDKKMKTIMSHKFPAWPLLPAEGTRFTKEKHEASVQFAKEKNMIPLKHHLIPRPKGFVTCIPILKNYNCPSVLSLNLAFDKNDKIMPSLGNLLLGKKVVCHIYIERISMNDVDATSECLQKIFLRKDAAQESFHNHGNFTEGTDQKEIKPMKMPARSCVLINTMCWMTLNVSMFLYFAATLLINGHFLTFIIVYGGIIGFFYLMTLNMLNASSLAKGSQYGKAK